MQPAAFVSDRAGRPGQYGVFNLRDLFRDTLHGRHIDAVFAGVDDRHFVNRRTAHRGHLIENNLRLRI